MGLKKDGILKPKLGGAGKKLAKGKQFTLKPVSIIYYTIREPNLFMA